MSFAYQAKAENTAKFIPYVSIEGNYNMITKSTAKAQENSDPEEEAYIKYKPSFNGSISFGVNYNNFDFGLNAGYLKANLKDQDGKSIPKSDYKTTFALINFRYNHHLANNTYCFGKIGCGIANSNYYFYEKDEDLRMSQNQSLSKVSMAYDLGIGVGYKLTKYISVELGYSFFSILNGNIKHNRIEQEDGIAKNIKGEIKSPSIHKIGLAIRYNF